MKTNTTKTFLVLTCICLLNSSCFKNFYLTNSQKSFSNSEAEKINSDPNKYLIIHFADQALELTKYTITKDSIVGELNKIEIPEHLLYLNPEENSSNSYKKRYGSAVLNEVHIYTNLKSNWPKTNQILLTSKDISRMDIYEKDANRTKVNHILSTIGVVTVFTSLLGALLFTMTISIPLNLAIAG